MFRIRRVYDDLVPSNQEAIRQVQQILRTQFYLLSEKEVNQIPDQLHNPFKYRFRSLLFVAEGHKGAVEGFALLLHEPVLNFCYLDYVSAAQRMTGRGIGGALYDRIREEAFSLKTKGIFFECLPDNPKLSPNPETRKQNASRLRFYERYGAYPIINTAYETPLKPGTTDPPYLVYDKLGQVTSLSRDDARTIVRAILERRYGDVASKQYIDTVVDSFNDDPVKLREPRYIKREEPLHIKSSTPADKRILLFINDRHSIHHIRERGYVESPVRINAILKELENTDIFQKEKARQFSDKYILEVHDKHFIDYLRKACASLEPGESVYPYVFPIRNLARPPKYLTVRSGYYCIDTFTPVNRNAYPAAKNAVNCALSAAENIARGHWLAYALVRPPGHHAEHRAFGGFCYMNSAAIAAQYLSKYGRVAILDIDHHHGNGQQNIFYKRSDVLTVSIHGHPNHSYPYFSGFKDEKGIGDGKGFNINYPLAENIDGNRYREILADALKKISRFRPAFLVVPLGLDTVKGDPTGSWLMNSRDLEANGRMIGLLHVPTLVVQEGGYSSRVLGVNARHFFLGLWSGTYSV